MASISQRQLKNLDWLETTGTTEFTLVDSNDIDGILLKYADKFKDELLVNIKRHQITASGTLESNIIITPPFNSSGKKILEISLPYYAKFVDKGVKGVKDSSNSPNSPYKFKNYGMSSDGRKSLKNYIQNSRKKVTASDTRKKRITAGEKKAKSLADIQLNRLIYLIKAYGIKTTNFYSDATDKAFKGLEKEISEAVAVKIAVNITK